MSSIDSIDLDEGNPNMFSCYGAMRSGYEVCWTCWDVREAYDNMGWEMKDEKISQCTGKSIISKYWSDYNYITVLQVYFLLFFINSYRVQRQQQKLWQLGCKR